MTEYKMRYFKQLVDKTMARTKSLYGKYEEYTKYFNHLAEQHWEMICGADDYMEELNYKFDSLMIDDKNNDIEKHETYSLEKLDDFKKLIETIFSKEIWSIEECRALHMIILKFIADFENKRLFITDKVEIEKMTDFIIQIQIHLETLRRFLEIVQEVFGAIRMLV